MSSQNKEEVTQNNQEEQKKEPTYWERVIKGKGTVAELWKAPKIQKALQNHNELIKKRNGS